MEPGTSTEHDGLMPIKASRLVIALLVAFCTVNAAFNYLRFQEQMPPLARGLLIYIAAGMLAAQAALHSIWTVFGNWYVVRRILISTIAAFCLFLAFFGIYAFYRFQRRVLWDADEFAVTCLCTPALLLAIQTPLWIMKLFLSLQVVEQRDGPTAKKTPPLSIRGLLLATAVAGAALGCLRAASTFVNQSPTEFVSIWIVVASVVAVISLLTTVPTLLATLLARQFEVHVLVAIAVQAIVFLGLVAILIMNAGMPPRDARWELSAISATIFASFVTTLTVPLLVARRMGYRLVRIGKQQSKATQAVERTS